MADRDARQIVAKTVNSAPQDIRSPGAPDTKPSSHVGSWSFESSVSATPHPLEPCFELFTVVGEGAVPRRGDGVITAPVSLESGREAAAVAHVVGSE